MADFDAKKMKRKIVLRSQRSWKYSVRRVG